ncbi:MAG: DNA repair protein RecO [Candidatus Moranbacteria bacterium]|nr:DNA repair protein RecO [Candidatus Moranbacteria bacterium]
MQKYTAIILSHYDVGEFDRIYIMYTLESGLVKAIGRGVRKPAAKLAGHLEPGTLSEVYIAKARGRGQIASAITISNFDGIKSSLGKLQAVIGVFKFFSRIFSEGEKDKKTFDLLSEFLKVLDGERNKNGGEKEKLIILAFWWKLFDRLGQRPEAARCVNCGTSLKKEKKNFFAVEKGGVVCPQCALEKKGLFDISDSQIKLLRLFLANPLIRIVKIRVAGEELRGLEKIKEIFLRFYFT